MSGQDKAVLYEAIAQAEKEAEERGFDAHPSQLVTDEGDYAVVPQWRLEQLEAAQEEEAEDLADLKQAAPAAYRRKMQKNKQKLAKKDAIYEIVKQAESGLDVFAALDIGGGSDEEEGSDEPTQRSGFAAGSAGQKESVPDAVMSKTGSSKSDPTYADAELIYDSKDGGLLSERWFAGTIDRALCESAVKSCMQGDYLVRKSASSSGYVLCVNDCGQAINYTISSEANGEFSFTSKAFKNLREVVKYSRSTPLKSVARAGMRLEINQPAILQPWLSLGLSRKECEDIVSSAAHGDFMVRLSSSGDKYVLVVNDKGTACSYSITYENDKFGFGGTSHSSVEDVVDTMKRKTFKSQNTYEMTLAKAAMNSLKMTTLKR